MSSAARRRRKKRSHKPSTKENGAENEVVEVEPATTHHDDALPPRSDDNQRAVDNWILTRENYRMSIAGPSDAAATGIQLFLARQRRLARDASLDLHEP